MINKILSTFAAVGVLGASALAADVVHLKNGGKIEGRVVERSATAVTVDVGGGTMTLQLTSVARIEEGRSRLDEYDDRLAALADDDIDGWAELAVWASRNGLSTHAIDAWEHILDLDADNERANRALGRMRFDGRWMPEEEAYRAQGLVKFEGRWMPPDERDTVLRERERRAETERIRIEAEARARAAEARAAEAEARAREAETEEPVYYAVPYYWGVWGPGHWQRPRPPHRPPKPRPRATSDRTGGGST